MDNIKEDLDKTLEEFAKKHNLALVNALTIETMDNLPAAIVGFVSLVQDEELKKVL